MKTSQDSRTNTAPSLAKIDWEYWLETDERVDLTFAADWSEYLTVSWLGKERDSLAQTLDSSPAITRSKALYKGACLSQQRELKESHTEQGITDLSDLIARVEALLLLKKLATYQNNRITLTERAEEYLYQVLERQTEINEESYDWMKGLGDCRRTTWNVYANYLNAASLRAIVTKLTKT